MGKYGDYIGQNGIESMACLGYTDKKDGEKMDSVNRTLYIPLYGKALVSRMGLFLQDEKAEQIWQQESFPLKGKAGSKWLAYSMAMRAAVFDRWLEDRRKQMPNAVVLHLGCGMDSRILRVGSAEGTWFDVDFPEVIRERQRYFGETEHYHMLGADLRDLTWLEKIPEGNAVVVMEGISMYLKTHQLQALLAALTAHFQQVAVLMDSYTTLGAKATKYKNPINTVGVTQVYGLDDPQTVVKGTALECIREVDMNPMDLIRQLPARDQKIFSRFFAGKLAKKLYRMYEYEKKSQ